MDLIFGILISPSARLWPQLVLLLTKIRSNNSRTRIESATTLLTKICTTTFESTNMWVLDSFGKHSKSYRPSRSSHSRKEHDPYLTPHKSDRVTRYKKQIDLDSSFNLRYPAPISVQWLMRKLPEPGSWTLKNFFFWTPWPKSHAT